MSAVADKNVDVDTTPRPAAETTSALNTPTFIINILSLLFSLYICLVVVKVNVKRATTDYHYRLRLSVGLSTLCMCLLHVIYQAILAFIGFVSSAEILYGMIVCFSALIILLVMFLTVDRYIRVCMILPQSFTYKLLNFACHVSSPIVLVLCIIYLLRSWWGPFRQNENINGWIEHNYSVQASNMFNLVKAGIEITFLSIAVATEYSLTFLMIRYSIQSSLAMTPNAYSHTHPLSHIQQSGKMISKEKQKFILWVMLCCGIILSVDAFNLGFQLYFARIGTYDQNGSGLEHIYLQMQILSISWISVRVYCIFKLLDAFLHQIKRIQQDGKKAKQELGTEMTDIKTNSYSNLDDPSCSLSNSGKPTEEYHGKLDSYDFRETISN